MKTFGLEYLLQFSKIQKGQIIGDIEAVDFKTINTETQMGDLIISCRCRRLNQNFQIEASILNWKITKFQKGSLKSLNYKTIQHSNS